MWIVQRVTRDHAQKVLRALVKKSDGGNVTRELVEQTSQQRIQRSISPRNRLARHGLRSSQCGDLALKVKYGGQHISQTPRVGKDTRHAQQRLDVSE